MDEAELNRLSVSPKSDEGLDTLEDDIEGLDLDD